MSPETNEVVLLEDVIESYLGERPVTVELIGRTGSGKTTSLAHLASLPFADELLLIDGAWRNDLRSAESDQLIIYASRVPQKERGHVSYELASWSIDDVVEYLLATNPNCCSSVVARFTADRDSDLLEGMPALVCLVADQMAAKEELQNVRSALRTGIAEFAGSEENLNDARFYAAASLLNERELAVSRAHAMTQQGIGRAFLGLMDPRFVQVLLCADRVVSLLKSDAECPFPTHRLPRDVVQEVARLASNDFVALERLQQLCQNGDVRYLPMTASVLHAVDHRWRPSRQDDLYLAGAYIPDANWESIDLRGADLREADLRGSDLRRANLENTQLHRANLGRLRGNGVRLTKSRAVQADFDRADLSQADLSNGNFLSARFTSANLDDAVATTAIFQDARLEAASLRRALLNGSDFRGASLQEVDFRDANLSGADLSKQNLRTVLLTGAIFEGTNLAEADLEFVDWPHARLVAARMTGAYMTGSKMARADLREAKLNGAGLAEIDWEEADLRSADMRGCSFHMGSSRSGLVGSPYPSYGTRTGFYTNDYEARTYKAPEEIRKANLYGADLRGALVTDVDFYLVDLRGARYDPQQEQHFRKCDAILENYVP